MSRRYIILARAAVLAVSASAAITPAMITLAMASPAGAAACAAKLGKSAQIIYNAVAPQVSGGGDLRGLVTDQTRGLVMSGQISRGDARPAAEAAGQCLEQLRS
ncbi:hypothetical protein [Chelatococcus asaccharovorans]|uniref:Uncharacterized protein n=1 Tax=Chelatococcus asaccharovorans TaxID=28210 RepID=A0A2V3TTC4_9HYPH|nr:hypothetical protein [Chelatococcus asaccharovorans]MBS7702600.1 hypothetical protein [Chelatococcus asaccharovorans]PXW52203.1 hypothetical protein C7450_11767 [Chelatococcus asaccharovorans]